MRTKGENAKISQDSNGALVSVDWICPHCRFENYSFDLAKGDGEIDGPFEIDIRCDECGEIVTVECETYDDLF